MVNCGRRLASRLKHGGVVLTRIVLNVWDDHKVEPLRILLRDLSYVEIQTDELPKVWDGSLKAIDNPITVGNFRTYSREELHER